MAVKDLVMLPMRTWSVGCRAPPELRSPAPRSPPPAAVTHVPMPGNHMPTMAPGTLYVASFSSRVACRASAL